MRSRLPAPCGSLLRHPPCHEVRFNTRGPAPSPSPNRPCNSLLLGRSGS
jgi:hypothetical protein